MNIELHCHPFLRKNSLIDVIRAMDAAGIDVLALESYNESIFPRVLEEAKKLPGIIASQKGVRLPNRTFLLNATEYSTLEDFHVLTIGHSGDYPIDIEIRRLIDASLDNNALVILDHPYVENTSTFTAGHISEEKERLLEDICREYKGKVAVEWNGYCKPYLRWALMHLLNLNGADIRYYDVNKRTETLSQRLHIPLVADTDLHARNIGLLSAMGTARIVADIDAFTPEGVVSQLKENIFSGNYENRREYVSLPHFVEAFGLPILYDVLKKRFPNLPDYFCKPRA